MFFELGEEGGEGREAQRVMERENCVLPMIAIGLSIAKKPITLPLNCFICLCCLFGFICVLVMKNRLMDW